MRTLAEMDMGRDRTPEYLRTHPEPSKRVKNIEQTRDSLLANGLTPTSTSAPSLDVKSVFGEIPTLAPQQSEWMPTTPGTEWTYGVSGGTGGASSYRVKAVGLSTVGSTPVARMELTIGGRAIPYQLIVDGGRIFRRNRPSEPASKWTVEFEIPEVGGSVGDDAKRFEALEVESVETPAGKFERCVKVRQTEGPKTILMWFARDVGLVRRIHEGSGTTEQLIAFRKA